MRPWSSCEIASRSKRGSRLASRRSGAHWTRWDCREKKSILSAEADSVERAEFRKKQQRLPVERLVYIDEFGVNTAMTPAYARSPRGTRAQVSEPFNHESNISVIRSLSLASVWATMSIEGRVNTQVFDAFVGHFLVPTPLKSDIVVLDNVKFHYSARAIGLIEAPGASVSHIPAYSPDFNPIEERISKIKGFLRELKARTSRKLLNALVKAIEKAPVDDICGWFTHCGYTFSFI
ncbi:MAG TPA: transposase [Blastocatellia bacterium]|jgi:transposase|nr:transposase [Blastocatellia bacterium]